MKRDHGGEPLARIDASVNLNPLGPPASLDAVFARSRELASRYPEIDATSAREAWARRLGIPVGQLLVGNGASELISLVVRAIGPRRVIVFDPCYSEYTVAARAARAHLAHVPLRLHGESWRTPVGGLLSGRIEDLAVGDGDLVVVGQPNNPTGHLTAVESLTELARSGAHVLADESFLALAESHSGVASTSSHSLVPLLGRRISVVASLTKSYCVPGLRLGYLAADESLVDRIGEIRDPWSVNGIAAEAAVALASEDGYLERARVLLDSERVRMESALASLGLRITDGVAPWVLAELPEPLGAGDLSSNLLTRGIAIRDASSFPGLSGRWVRIGVRTPAENDGIIVALRDVLGRS